MPCTRRLRNPIQFWGVRSNNALSSSLPDSMSMDDRLEFSVPPPCGKSPVTQNLNQVKGGSYTRTIPSFAQKNEGNANEPLLRRSNECDEAHSLDSDNAAVNVKVDSPIKAYDGQCYPSTHSASGSLYITNTRYEGVKDDAQDAMTVWNHMSTPMLDHPSVSASKDLMGRPTSKKGWDMLASQWWNRLSQKSNASQTTLANGITNLLGIDPPIPFKGAHMIQASDNFFLKSSETPTFVENDNNPPPNINTSHTDEMSYDISIPSINVHQCNESSSDELKELKSLLKINQKAYTQELNALHETIKKLEHDQQVLMDRLQTTNDEREEQEMLITTLATNLNESNRQLLLLKSELLHYKCIVRSLRLYNVSSILTPFLMTSLSPFEAYLMIGEKSSVRVMLELATSNQGSAYLIITSDTTYAIDLSQVPYIDLIPLDTGCRAKLHIFVLHRGWLVFLIETRHSLQQCIILSSAMKQRENNLPSPPIQKKKDNNVTSLFAQLQHFFTGQSPKIERPSLPHSKENRPLGSRLTKSTQDTVYSCHPSSREDYQSCESAVAKDVPSKTSVMFEKQKPRMPYITYPFSQLKCPSPATLKTDQSGAPNQEVSEFYLQNLVTRLNDISSKATDGGESSSCLQSNSLLTPQRRKQNAFSSPVINHTIDNRTHNITGENKYPPSPRTTVSKARSCAPKTTVNSTSNQYTTCKVPNWVSKDPFHLLENELINHETLTSSGSSLSLFSSIPTVQGIATKDASVMSAKCSDAFKAQSPFVTFDQLNSDSCSVVSPLSPSSEWVDLSPCNTFIQDKNSRNRRAPHIRRSRKPIRAVKVHLGGITIHTKPTGSHRKVVLPSCRLCPSTRHSTQNRHIEDKI